MKPSRLDAAAFFRHFPAPGSTPVESAPMKRRYDISTANAAQPELCERERMEG
jgi:hypothetical protein